MDPVRTSRKNGLNSRERKKRIKSLFSPFVPVQLLLTFASALLPCTVIAHRLDEYLQATLVVIEPDSVRFKMNLTPGIAVSKQVLSLIARGRDGVISTNEAVAYCEMLKHDLVVQLDQQILNLKLSNSYFPRADELLTGWGFIQIEFSAEPGRLSAGSHTLAIENRHLPNLSVYLVNAAQAQSASIEITKQIRNENQSIAQFQFTYQPPPNSFTGIGLLAFLLILIVSVSAGAHRLRTFASSPAH